MKIIAVDDEPLALEDLVHTVKQVRPDADVKWFTDADELLEYAIDAECDVAFLDIEMGSVSGIDVAKKLKISNPGVNIVFVTGYNDYVHTAMRLRASGYVMKPASAEDIADELDNLRNPIAVDSNARCVVRCFGTFDVFVDGRSLEFKRGKTKEMLAYLVDRRGSAVTSGELRAVLWQNVQSDDNTGVYLQKLKKDLTETLRQAGVGDVFLTSWNKYSIDPAKISCDYYDYLDDKPEGVRAYNGEYMSQYSWGEIQNVILADKN